MSEVSLGSWLTYGGSVGEETATQCMHRAFDLGVNFFDTANGYSRGRAEEVVGAALKAFPRDEYVLATKVYFPMKDVPNGGGLSRKHVWEQCHASLRRLDVEYIDLYQCHRYDVRTPLEETCRVMDDLIRQGKVLYWGVSEWNADQIAHAVQLCRAEGWAPPVSNQPQYSALYRVIERGVLQTSEDLGVGNVVWSPLAQGVLTGKYVKADEVPEGSRASNENDAQFVRRWLQQDVLDAVQSLRPVADEAGVTLAQLALAWCLRQKLVSSVIVGASRPEQVDDNVKAAEVTVDPALLQRVTDVLDPVAVKRA